MCDAGQWRYRWHTSTDGQRQTWIPQSASYQLLPQERARGVHQIFMEALDRHAEEHEDKDQPTFWDLLCWAVEYTSQQSIAIDDPRFMAICVQLNRQLWAIHYSSAERIYSREDKLETEIRSSNITGDGDDE